jgi:MoxR-like ATPase
MDHSVGYSLHRIYCRQMLGTMIYNIKQNEFSIKKAYFANFVLADEINRAPAKVQSALEAMQENK